MLDTQLTMSIYSATVSFFGSMSLNFLTKYSYNIMQNKFLKLI